MLCSNDSLIIFLQCLAVALSACTFPSAFVNTTWYDSDKGGLNFTDSEMSGWPITGGGQTISLWECFYQQTYSSHMIVIYKATSSIAYFEGPFRIFICMNLTEVTSSSYYYYQMSPEQSRLGEERLTAMAEANVSSIVMDDAELTLCETDSTLVPSVNEYHVLVKSGMESEATQLCDSSFYGRYWYNISEDGVTWSCDNTSYWDVCSDRQYMVFNYSTSNCQSLRIASSDLGEVRCLVSISSGTNVLQTVSTTANTTNNFTCMLSRLDEETDQVYATMSPGSCTKTQTTDSLPILADGITTVGQIIHLTPYPEGLCPITYDSSEYTVPVGVIVGGVLGAIALLAITAILILLCMWCCKAKPTEHKDENEANKSRRFQATKCFPSTKCLPNCLILGKKTAGKDKFKGDDMTIEGVKHERFPPFIHEQPGVAPNGTSFLTDEGKEMSNRLADAPSPPLDKSEDNCMSMTPVELPDREDICSNTSHFVRSPNGKQMSLSSVSLDIESIKDGKIRSISKRSGYEGSLYRTNATYKERENDSRLSDHVSALSKYLDTSLELQDLVESSLDDVRADSRCASCQTDITNESVELYKTIDKARPASLGLKPILPISSCDSFSFKSPDKLTEIKPSNTPSKLSDKSRTEVTTPFKLTQKRTKASSTKSGLLSATSGKRDTQSRTSDNTLSSFSLFSTTSESPIQSYQNKETNYSNSRLSGEHTSSNKDLNVHSDILCTHGTQTEISSLEVLFRAHDLPDQMYPKSVKSGIYYISDSPLEPIEEKAEHTSALGSAKDTSGDSDHVSENTQDNPNLRIYSEKTSSSGWITIAEETIDGADKLDSMSNSSAEEYKSNPVYKLHNYDGYEPDTD